ncbi:hypothetical protein AALA00_13730 [Lachnospiraceae bacterium 46-15]
MADIKEDLKKILSAVYGKDVRQAIHDSIQLCGSDSKEAVDTSVTAANTARSALNIAGEASDAAAAALSMAETASSAADAASKTAAAASAMANSMVEAVSGVVINAEMVAITCALTTDSVEFKSVVGVWNADNGTYSQGGEMYNIYDVRAEPIPVSAGETYLVITELDFAISTPTFSVEPILFDSIDPINYRPDFVMSGYNTPLLEGGNAYLFTVPDDGTDHIKVTCCTSNPDMSIIVRKVKPIFYGK